MYETTIKDLIDEIETLDEKSFDDYVTVLKNKTGKDINDKILIEVLKGIDKIRGS